MTETGSRAPASPKPIPNPQGLTQLEAKSRLIQFGPNALPQSRFSTMRMVLGKFWAPVPWLLEAAIILQLALGDRIEAAVVAGLLLFNGALGVFQEGRAKATLDALKSRLAISASVRRDGTWQTEPAVNLVPGDLVKLSLGGVVAADMMVQSGEILLDQSMLTGESIPVEAGPGVQIFSSALVLRGEATASVEATGAKTKFGRTAELVSIAHSVSSQQKAVLRVISNLAVCNGMIILSLATYAAFLKLPLIQIIPLVLTGILASIPVALPATFTLASALGARVLAAQGVLLTRLSAADEAASIDVLCADKTGTLTCNTLKVSKVKPMPGFDTAHILALAALTSSDGGQDPVDAAIRAASAQSPIPDPPKPIRFKPFDPATKMSSADFTNAQGVETHVVKGAFEVVMALTASNQAIASAAHKFQANGFRVLGVAFGGAGEMKLAGLIALSDPPREDSSTLISELHTLGVRVVMITGDAPATAASVAHAVGLSGAACPPGPIPDHVRPEDYAVFAGVLPEDKFKLVKAYQNDGHVVGMCGDGANDAPALRQAQMGIAVSTATDVAKSAAGMVLTAPGLGGIVAAVKQGRTIFQRIETYTLNSITSKILQVLFLAIGLLITGHAILTPMLMVIIMITGDFLGMSLTTDHVRPSALPNAWRIRQLTVAGITMGTGSLIFCTFILILGMKRLEFDIERLRTLAFVSIVFIKQATTYTNRERLRMWSSVPGKWVIASSILDVLIALVLSLRGIAMTALPVYVVAGIFSGAALSAVVLDTIKVPVFKRLGIS